MTRAIHAISALLMVAGLVLLAYVGVSYERQKSAVQPAQWGAAQREQGQQIATRLIADRRTTSVNTRHTSGSEGREPGLRMMIPKINLNAPIVQTAPVDGVWEVADWSVGHLTTTPNPGAIGNAAYAAHDDIKGEIFKRLGELKPGDKIFLRTRHYVYTYVVSNQLTVDPSDTQVLEPTPNSTVTLISCAPYWVDTQRLIVQGVLKSRSAV